MFHIQKKLLASNSGQTSENGKRKSHLPLAQPAFSVLSLFSERG